MNLTDYTSYAEIRAVLGVSEEELLDADLALPMHLTALENNLLEVSDIMLSTYSTVKNIAVGSRTADQQKFFLLTQYYSAYAVGEELLASSAMFGFKRVTDGKAEAERFDKFADLKDGILKAASVTRKRLKLALGTLGLGYSAPAAVTAIPIAGITGGTDPVTGV